TGGALTSSDLTATGSTSLSNYTLPVSDNGTGSITPAVLTYVAAHTGSYSGQPLPSFSGTVTGFISGQDLGSATTGNLFWTTSARVSSAPGTYAIDGSGLTADHNNYVFMQDPNNASALLLQPGTIAGFAAAYPGLSPVPSVITGADDLRFAIPSISPYKHVPVVGLPRRGYESVRHTNDRADANYPVIKKTAHHQSLYMAIHIIDGGVNRPASMSKVSKDGTS
ncbi:MAG: MBG domain-containing protein, partial [Acidiferrobacteraceae bacterium]